MCESRLWTISWLWVLDFQFCDIYVDSYLVVYPCYIYIYIYLLMAQHRHAPLPSTERTRYSSLVAAIAFLSWKVTAHSSMDSLMQSGSFEHVAQPDLHLVVLKPAQPHFRTAVASLRMQAYIHAKIWRMASTVWSMTYEVWHLTCDIITYICTCIHTYTHSYIHHTNRQTNKHTYIHPFIYTYIDTDIHTYIHAKWRPRRRWWSCWGEKRLRSHDSAVKNPDRCDWP